jgi:hypothetical protein
MILELGFGITDRITGLNYNLYYNSVMEDLTSFSLRIPKALARSIEAEAKRSGLNKSEYARRALEDFNQRVMHERIAEISRRLAYESTAAAESMEPSTSDGLA